MLPKRPLLPSDNCTLGAVDDECRQGNKARAPRGHWAGPTILHCEFVGVRARVYVCVCVCTRVCVCSTCMMYVSIHSHNVHVETDVTDVMIYFTYYTQNDTDFARPVRYMRPGSLAGTLQTV